VSWVGGGGEDENLGGEKTEWNSIYSYLSTLTTY